MAPSSHLPLGVLLLLSFSPSSSLASLSSFADQWSQLAASDVKPFYGCEKNAFPPNQSNAVPKYTINLDLQPEQRWLSLVDDKKTELVYLIDYVYNFTETLLGERVFYYLLNHTNEVFITLPAIYQKEMTGIAQASGLTTDQITVYNIFYELFTLCTSIVVQSEEGDVYQGRNLDFGLFLGWDPKTKDWRIAEKLRSLIIDLDWTRGKETVFKSASFVGYVGILTGVKPGVFSLTIDERFSLNGGFVGLFEWIFFKDYDQKWMSFLTREVMENANSYYDAVNMLQTPRLLAPVYFIVSGIEENEGCIITRYRDDYITKHLLDSSDSWYLVQTNYDFWKDPPFYDDRRNPAMQCLDQSRMINDSETDKSVEKSSNSWWDLIDSMQKQVTSRVRKLLRYSVSSRDESQQMKIKLPLSPPSNESFSLLYNVLSTRPVLNKLTTYTSLMSAKYGKLDTYLQYCSDPCWPW